MALSLADMVGEIRSLVNEDVEDFFTDTEIENWLHLGAMNVSAVALNSCTRVTVDMPAADMEASLNKFADGALSGTPRVLIVSSGGMDVYLKVYPTYAGVDGEADPEAFRTYADGAVSGDRLHVGFEYDDQFFWTAGNDTLTPEAGATADDVCTDPYVREPESSISGTPYVFGILSGGVRYYFKAYLMSGVEMSSGVTIVDPGVDFLKIRAAYIGINTTGTGAALATEAEDTLLTEGGDPITEEGAEWTYSKVRALVRAHHSMIGHVIDGAEYPIFYAYWEGKVWVWPMGVRSYSLLLYPAQLVTAAESLPYLLQVPCMTFAAGLAHLKDERLPAAIDLFTKSRAEAFFYRETVYANFPDSRDVYRIG